MIALALIDLSRVMYGTHIRISELTQNLEIPIIHSTTQTRILKYLKNAPKLLKSRDILLFGSRERFFDNLSLSIIKTPGNRIIYDAADLPHLQNYYFLGTNIDEGLARKFYSLIRVADVVVIISKSAKGLFQQNSIRDKRILVVPNASNPDFFKPSPQPNETKTILYVGGYAKTRGVDDLVAAFNLIKDKYHEVRLRLIGSNIPPKFRSEWISVENDKIYADMPRIQASSFACVIPHKRNPYMDAALPVKLYDAMASARPVIVTDCLEAQQLVNHERCGLVAHDNPSSIAEALEYIINHPEVAEEMGQKGREAIVKRHSWNIRARSLKQQLRQ